MLGLPSLEHIYGVAHMARLSATHVHMGAKTSRLPSGYVRYGEYAAQWAAVESHQASGNIGL